MQSELEKENVKRFSNNVSNHLTKKCLKKALLNLLLEKPFESISITELVKKAGVSRITFYRNFESKEELLEDIYEDVGNKYKEVFSNKKYGNNKYEMFFDLFSYLKEHPYKVFTSVYIEILFKNIFNDRVFEAKSKEDEYEITIFSGAFTSITRKWIENDYDESVEFMAKLCEKSFKYDWF